MYGSATSFGKGLDIALLATARTGGDAFNSTEAFETALAAACGCGCGAGCSCNCGPGTGATPSSSASLAAATPYLCRIFLNISASSPTYFLRRTSTSPSLSGLCSLYSEVSRALQSFCFFAGAGAERQTAA